VRVNRAGRFSVGEDQPSEFAVWHEFLDQRKELSLLEPDMCVKQLSRHIQRLSIDDAGRHGDVELASEPFELHMLDACLVEGTRLGRDVPEEKREELLFFIPKVDALFVPEELPEFPGRSKPSRSIAVRGSTPQPHCLHESVVMVAREWDQAGVALHPTTLGCSVVPRQGGTRCHPRPGRPRDGVGPRRSPYPAPFKAPDDWVYRAVLVGVTAPRGSFIMRSILKPPVLAARQTSAAARARKKMLRNVV
jgi:hypothetical protein